MTSSSSKQSRYSLSFTSGGLLEREAEILAPVYLAHRDWEKVRAIAVAENLLKTRTQRTSSVNTRETIKRLKTLSERELSELTDLTSNERAYVMWAATCRCFEFIGEFAEEVLRERFLVFANSISHDDYDSFYRAKALWHEELNNVTDQTYRKLRQMVFKMMGDAGLLSKEGVIEPALLSARVTEYFNERTPSDMRFFPVRQG